MNTPIQDDVRHVVSGLNRFAIDLYRQLGDDRHRQFFFSPYSIACALGMTLVGAKEKTAQEIAEVLHLSIPQPRIHQAFAELFAITNPEGIQFNLANRLWCQEGYHLLPEAIQILDDGYQSTIGRVDFQNPRTACARINRWVQEETRGKIKRLVDDLPERTRMILTNAIYFAAEWMSEFDDNRTKDAYFHVASGRTTNIQMMRQTGHFPYAEHPLGQVVQLPYRGLSQELDCSLLSEEDVDEEWKIPHISVPSPSDFAMTVMLPREQGQLLELECHLEDVVAISASHMETRRVRLEIPRFKMSSLELLAEPLSNLGMKQVFDLSHANFQGFSHAPEGLFVSEAVHQAEIEVNETGTVAAAATAVVLAGGSAQIEQPIHFRANHPFAFLISDKQTGLIHFMGRETCPNSE